MGGEPIGAERGRMLVGLARAAIAHELGGASEGDGSEGDGPERDDLEPWLREPGAVFVTLRNDGALRGCIGSLEAHSPLIEDLRANARAAALSDPRFPPVDLEELPALEISVSLISPSEPLPVASEAEARRRLRPGRDGVILRFREHRATFLPQVWEQLPDPERFLERLKEKAGLEPDFWHRELELRRYRVETWGSERSPPPSSR